MKLVLTGGTGLVGAALIPLLHNHFDLCVPMRDELDLLHIESILGYIRREKPEIILHVAGYVNAGEGEKERGSIHGMCYRTNVTGTNAVIEAAHQIDAFVLYISTGSVFHGTVQTPGPFEIDDPPEADPEKNGWYGYTKYLGELAGPDAIVRISHPIVPNGVRPDYIFNILNLYERHALFPLFPDQYFPLTDMKDLAHSITTILNKRVCGIFHVASPDMITPYEMVIYALQLLGKPMDNRIQKLSIDDFYKQGNSSLRFAKYSAISSKKTEEKLKLTFTSWKNILMESLHP